VCRWDAVWFNLQGEAAFLSILVVFFSDRQDMEDIEDVEDLRG